jgi:hypothetical protein
MAIHMTASAPDLAAVQVTTIGVVVALGLVVRTASLVAAVARLATARFPLTRSVPALRGSRFRNAREPRSNSR